ncbi:MAG: DUF6508 domain-containing protein [Planctomycetota bacterium]|jgi:hypothetical protein
MGYSEHKELTPEGIKKILEYLPKLKDKDSNTGKWHPIEEHDDNTFTLPFYEYSDLVIGFKHTLYNEGFIFPFDWGSWHYGKKLSRNPDLIKKANLLTLRKLITAHVRQDRFCEGHLACVFKSGLIVKILERLQEISA